MKTIQELNQQTAPIVSVDESLAVYGQQVLFPEKLAKANQMLQTAKLPLSKRTKK